jgi:hypothetical protein
MINSVRNTVLNIINKDNNGFITPEEFNSFAKQAQLELFMQYFFDFQQAKIKDMKGMESSGYSDITKQIDQTIDYFSKNTDLVYNGTDDKFDLPENFFLLNVLYYNGKEVTHVDQGKLYYLLNSNLTAPTETYPTYVMQGNQISVYPTTIVDDINIYYVRYPADPKWTYTVVNGSPLFNQSANDYQDFELPAEDGYKLVTKMLEYCGIVIREIEVSQFGTAQQQHEQPSFSMQQ